MASGVDFEMSYILSDSHKTKKRMRTLTLTDKIAAFVRLTGLDHQYAPHAGRYRLLRLQRADRLSERRMLNVIIVLREEGAPSSGFFIRG